MKRQTLVWTGLMTLFLCQSGQSTDENFSPEKPDAILAVNCTFSNGHSSNITNLVSLTISTSDDPNNNNNNTGTIQLPQQLVTISIFQPDSVTVLVPTLKAVTTGRLDVQGVSYLSLQWQTATSDYGSRLFHCEAHGLNNNGHPLDVSYPPQVIVADHSDDAVLLPEIKAQAERITKLQARLDLLNSTVEYGTGIQKKQAENLTLAMIVLQNLTSAVDRLNVRLTQVEDTCGMTCNNTNDVTYDSTLASLSQRLKQLEEAACCKPDLNETQSRFIRSEVYNGKQYLISNKGAPESAMAEIACFGQGGYLAEIMDDQEYQFIRQFLSSYLPTIYYMVLVGASNENKGQWEYRYSHIPVVFSDWADGEPSSSVNEACMFLQFKHVSNATKMYDLNCFISDVHLTYLCEVPPEEIP